MYRSSLPQDPLALIALNRDVFFGVKLRNLAKELGYDMVLVPGAKQLATALEEKHAKAALIIIDTNVIHEAVDWEHVTQILRDYPAVPSLAFGSHTDADTLRAAKSAGLTRVTSNGDFHMNAASLIQRYARVDEDDQNDD